MAGLKRGTIESGSDGKFWIYMGGDETDKNNWKPVNPVTLPNMQQSMQEELASRNPLERFNAAWGTAGLDQPALGLKRAVTGLSPEELQRAALNKQIISSGVAGKLGSMGGVVSTLAAPSGAISGLAAQAPGAMARFGLDAAGQGALGYLYGGMSTPDDPRSGAAAGAAAGVLGSAAAKIIQGIARPAAGSAADALQQEGVPITPGQASKQPSILRWLEERARVGSTATVRRHGEALEAWSANVVNKVLPPGAPKLQPGPDLIKNAAQTFDDAYEAIISKHTQGMPRPIIQDAAFKTKLGEIYQQFRAGMIPEQARELSGRLAWLRKQFVSDTISPRALKDLRQEVQQLSTEAFNGGHGELGKAYAEAAKSLNGLMQRRAPQLAADLAVVDHKYAQWLRVQAAAGKVGVEEGVFTPKQLLAAIRELDTTAQKRAFARGTTVPELRDLASKGQQVLGMSIPAVGPGTAEKAVIPFATQNMLAVAPYAAAQLGYSKPVMPFLMGRAPGQQILGPPAGLLPSAAIAEREELIKRGLLGPDY